MARALRFTIRCLESLVLNPKEFLRNKDQIAEQEWKLIIVGGICLYFSPLVGDVFDF